MRNLTQSTMKYNMKLEPYTHSIKTHFQLMNQQSIHDFKSQ